MITGTFVAAHRPIDRLFRVVGMFVLIGLVPLSGCEVDSFLDPSVVGRWERTPVVLPILDRLNVIDAPAYQVEGLSQVQPEDLIQEVREYVIGPGDVISVSVFELMQTNVDSVLSRRVDELGMIRLPVIGQVKAQGTTPSGLESQIVRFLDTAGILKNAIVSVGVQDGRQNTFSIIGDPRGGAAVGSYLIPKSDFRLLEALALARGVSDEVKVIHVIRSLPLSEASPLSESSPQGVGPDPIPVTDPLNQPRDAADLIDDLLNSVDEDFQTETDRPTDEDGATDRSVEALERTMDTVLDQSVQWAYVNGQWVRVDSVVQNQADPTASVSMAGDQVVPAVTHRVIEVPYDQLVKGDMRYNIVIRPGDSIRVQPPVSGNVYIGGAISRPGTYALPGAEALTVKQLVFAAGNLAGVAVPERVDLIRRLDAHQEATVRLDLRAIFNGTQPDFYLKPNDILNIGTSFASVPLAVLRNGFRLSYGFGFILDRNFGPEVFGPIPRDNN